MRNVLLIFLISTGSIAIAQAQVPASTNGKNESNARRPAIAGPPAWVAVADIPPVPAAADGAASVNVLVDRQTRFEGGGTNTYVDVARKIMTSQGLADGSLQIDWDPSLERLTLHNYRILRGGTSIDMLGDGSKLTIMQREKEMDNAVLDGQLTASMQPTDIRVGDIVQYSFTRERRDPALGDHVELLTGPADGATFGRLRSRLIWPSTTKVNWRAFPGVVLPKLTKTALGNELTTDLKDVRTPLPPQGAPTRFRAINAIEVSSFPDWAAVARTMLPFYAKAATLAPASEIRAQASRIAATSNDPIRRTELALALVQDQVRYLYLGMEDGGYIPVAADLTWSRRFGDCKGKTVLLLALLKELGVQAEPVLVNTQQGDFVQTRLPALGAFDHVIVRATIGGRAYWLDGTRLGDTNLSVLRTPSYTSGLPVSAASTGLVAMIPEALMEPSDTASLDLDASAGIDAPAVATGELRYRGMAATNMRVKYAGLSAVDLQQQLRALWRKNYDFISPTSVSTTTDPKTGDFLISMNGTAKMDWYTDVGTRWYEVDGSRLGWKFDTDRTGMINAEAPFAIEYPEFWESRQRIKLPNGGKGFTLQGEQIDQQLQGIYSVQRKVAIVDGVLAMEARTRALAAELPITRAEKARSELAALRTKGAYVRVPEEYEATEADLVALKNDKQALSNALMRRGAVRSDRGEYKAALADEDAALAIDPKLPQAHAIRAIALSGLNDPRTNAAADAALALDPKQMLAWRAKAILAANQGRHADADAALTKILTIDPSDSDAYLRRSGNRLLMENFTGALADADEGLAIKPSALLWLSRSAALAASARLDEALVSVDRAVAADPDLLQARHVRAKFREAAGKPELAVNDYDELIRREPSAKYYVARAQLRAAGQEAKRNEDLAAALKLDPGSHEALTLRAAIAIEAKDFAAANSDIAQLQRLKADAQTIHSLRSEMLKKQGKTAELFKLMDDFIARNPKDATALNERCWAKATLNVSIDTALADCDASLKLRPNSPATLDSRAFVWLRLGQNAAAITDYNEALKFAPTMVASLYGRAIAKARQGDLTGARADLESARAQKTEIEARFLSYGMTLPPELAAARLGGAASPER